MTEKGYNAAGATVKILLRGVISGLIMFLPAGSGVHARHPDPDATVFAVVNPKVYDMKGFVRQRLSSASEIDKKQAARLAAEGRDLHRKNNNPIGGLRAYEKAILLYPDPGYYYEIGNCLAGGREYGEAIRAYNAAVERGYRQKHLAYYNAACASSLMKDAGQAMEYLELALASGYSSLVYIRKDPDMAFMHGSDAFHRLLSVYESTLSPVERRLVGVWQDSPVMASGWGDTYLFHHDGKFVFYANQMDCGKRLAAEYGTWRCEGTVLHLVVTMRMVIEGGKLVPASGSCASKYEIEGGKPVMRDTAPASRKLRWKAPSLDRDAPAARYRISIDGRNYWRFSIRVEDYR